MKQKVKAGWGRLFKRRSPPESSPDPMEALLQEGQTHLQERDRILQKKEELAREVEESATMVREVREKLSTFTSEDDIPSDDIPSEMDEALTEVEKRVEKTAQDSEKINQELTSLAEAAQKLQERSAKERSKFHNAHVEFNKMLFEVFKLVATLDTGVLIAMTAITVGLISDPGRLTLFFVSSGLVFFSIGVSVLGCVLQAVRISDALYPGVYKPLSKGYWFNFLGSILSLIVGMSLFLQFLLYNLN